MSMHNSRISNRRQELRLDNQSRKLSYTPKKESSRSLKRQQIKHILEIKKKYVKISKKSLKRVKCSEMDKKVYVFYSFDVTLIEEYSNAGENGGLTCWRSLRIFQNEYKRSLSVLRIFRNRLKIYPSEKFIRPYK